MMTKIEIEKILKENNLSPLKCFGQNFLVDSLALEKITEQIVGKGENLNILEIGPGLASLSLGILSHNCFLTSIEIDRAFSKYITKLIEKNNLNNNWTVINADALKILFDSKLLKNDDEKTKILNSDVVCGNLPYNIGTVLVCKIIENGIYEKYPQKMVFLLQKELADKFIISSKLTNLAILADTEYEVKKTLTLSPSSFYPKPKVYSSLLSFTKKKSKFDCKIKKSYLDFSKILFSMPRKTIRNNLKSYISNKSNEKDFDFKKFESENSFMLNKRAEDLNLRELEELFLRFFEF